MYLVSQSRSKDAYGLDFGFSVSPAALIQVCSHGNDVYLREMIYETKLTNQQLGKKIQSLGLSWPIVADSAEPKSIKELQNMEIKIIGAAKGSDSIRAGIDDLLSKNIHITEDSKNMIFEAENYCWKPNKYGFYTEPEPEKENDHGWDAVRYCRSRMKKKRLA